MLGHLAGCPEGFLKWERGGLKGEMPGKRIGI